jgi:hypothetical protein
MAVETFVDFMNGGSLLGTLAGIAIAVCLLPLVVLIHEAGHSLAALAVGHRVTKVVVGDDRPLLTVSGNGFRLRLGPVTGTGGVAGYVCHGSDKVEPRDVFLTALAGPVASLAGAVATGLLAVWAWPQPSLTVCLAIATLAGLVTGVSNLRVSGDGPDDWSDGVWVRGAWRAMRRPAGWADPHETTSVAPPG